MSVPPLSKGTRLIAFAAVLCPLALAALMIANCWVHGKTRQECDPDAQIPELVQSVVTSVFAWMAAPPQ